jgi:hypothetical protein
MYERHRSTLGALHLVLGVMNLIAAAIIWVVLGGTALLASADPEAVQILGVVSGLVSTILIIVAVPPIVASIGLSQQKSWGRAAAIISSFLNLTSIPFGSAVSIYSLWVLFTDAQHEAA